MELLPQSVYPFPMDQPLSSYYIIISSTNSGLFWDTSGTESGQAWSVGGTKKMKLDSKTLTLDDALDVGTNALTAGSFTFGQDNKSLIDYDSKGPIIRVKPDGKNTLVVADSGIQVSGDLVQGFGTATFTGSVVLDTQQTDSVPYLGHTKDIQTVQLTNGQVLIGRTGDTPTAGTITGTTNRVSVTNGSGSITLSTPQDIGTSSNVQFNDNCNAFFPFSLVER